MPRIVVLLAPGFALAVFLATSTTLRATVATHFAARGRANGFMTRVGCQVFFCGLVTFVVVVGSGSFAWLPARFPRTPNLPHRDHWLEPPRSEATLQTLRAGGAAMAVSMLALLFLIHLLVVDAHARTPPALHEAATLAVLGVFVALLVAVLVASYLRFRTPG